MHAPTRDPIRDGRIRHAFHLELPDDFRAQAEAALGHLFDLPDGVEDPQPFAVRSRETEAVRVSAGSEGWCIESGGVTERALSDDAALLRLQELLLESAVRRES